MMVFDYIKANDEPQIRNMTKIKAKRSQDRQPAGKHPTRVPIKTVTPLPPPATQKQLRKARAKSVAQLPSAHGMTTRSRARNFRFLDLPPEIRAIIYAEACAEPSEPLDLSNFKLPLQLSVSSMLRSEALPVFFSTTTFTAKFRSNWCVRAEHIHGPEYIRYMESGKLDLSPYLRNTPVALPKEAVRFHNINFSVQCACCVQERVIGSLELRVVDRKPFVVNSSSISSNSETKKVWTRMVEGVESQAKQIGARHLFNGFTIDDLVELAVCFRLEDEDDAHSM
jgi:hypothetical protein